MVDVSNGEAVADDTIRSALASALASQEEQPDPTPEAKPDASIKADDADADAGDHDGAGADRTEAKPEGDGKEAKGAKTEGDDKGEPDKTAATTKEPPAAWSDADKATFKALPEPAQAFLLKRHTQMEADYTKKTQAISELKKEYEPVEQMFSPYRDQMKAKGFTPRSLIESWANVEKRLAQSETDAVEVVKGLVSGYKIPIAKIAAALGLSQAASGATAKAADAADGALPKPDAAAQQIQLPPELQQKLSGIESFIQQETQRRNSEAAARRAEGEQRVVQEIESFKTATDAKGNLLHPHFDDVEAEMTALANAALAMRQPVPALEALYEKAVWATPSTREKLRTAEQQAADRKRAEEARSKSAAAKKAAASVTGAPGAGQAPTNRRASERSIREELEEAADNIESVA
jgi:hypothetical protein